jgi:hypothetical protein
VWGVPLANYWLVPGVVLAHSILFRGLVDSRSWRIRHEASRPVDERSVLDPAIGAIGRYVPWGNLVGVVAGSAALTLTTLEAGYILYMAVGEWVLVGLLVGTCVLAGVGSLISRVVHGEDLLRLPVSPLLAVVVGGCFAMNTSRISGMPRGMTAGMLATQLCVVVSTMALILLPMSLKGPTPSSRNSLRGGSSRRD